ncbi:MAG: class I SAM-dependent methyltransferase [Geobacter sp.]|nr:class I SAM-dependent methyltransferase [Geobacter sp.]
MRALQQSHAGLQQQHAGLQQQHAELQQQHTELQQSHHNLTRQVEILKVEKHNLERALGALTEMPQLPFSQTKDAPLFMQQAAARLGVSMPPEQSEEAFYSWFSEIWPDGYKEVLHRQYEAYLPVIPAAGGAALDIGCGAGEFLTFLEGHGIPAEGVDRDPAEVRRAVSRGLKASQADGLTFLSASRERYRVVSLIEVAEHIPGEVLLPLLQAAVSKLQPGGVLVVETINLRHPLALQGFYTDPSHIRPLPDDYLAFLFQWLGLQQVQIIYTSPAWLPGIHHDDYTRIYYNYAVIGTLPP